MVAKFAIFSCLVAAAAAVAVPIVPVAKLAYAEHEAPAHYDFEYSVHDDHSGDIKQQKESRAGDVVQGFYSLVQPDGVHRIVEYTADNEHGFNANVRYEGHPIAQPAKIAYAAPVQNIAYAAPVPKLAYSAPVTKLAYPGSITKVAYAPAPVTYAQSPLTKIAYPAPLAYAQAPITKVAYAPAPVAYASAPVAKVAYSAPLGHVSFSSPGITYQH
ncbi:cuticular protein RR-2 motif 77 precursor [Bombyx mori]|uniref:Putative cuticle protein n=1 Tax=Bombyx mori TaxID=7091 RepID=C0H6R9_BOMMO|nr:cuticular protein RR-2 motif 77 precursor [Bombyx mori]FAA00580.1 TPA: putative cuticle protein [Bombyx mori]